MKAFFNHYLGNLIWPTTSSVSDARDDKWLWCEYHQLAKNTDKSLTLSGISVNQNGFGDGKIPHEKNEMRNVTGKDCARSQFSKMLKKATAECAFL